MERRVARAVLRLARQAGRKTDAGILIDLPLSRQDLAEMTGTTLYSVSRILSGWEAAGLVEVGRERVVIKRGHGLVIDRGRPAWSRLTQRSGRAAWAAVQGIEESATLRQRKDDFELDAILFTNERGDDL